MAVSVACGSPGGSTIVAVKFLDELPVEKRAAGSIEDAVKTDDAGSGSNHARALYMRAPARVIWSITIPHHARLQTAVALVRDRTNTSAPLGSGVTIRVGIADKRSYEELARVAVTPSAAGAPAWQPIDIDLGAYRGWQWSLFYRPDETPWRINFSVDAIPGPGTVAWKEPVVTTAR
jgi:hypothetical protein